MQTVEQRLRAALTEVGRKLMAIEGTVPIAKEAQHIALAALQSLPPSAAVDAPATWNGSWATPLTMGRHQRSDDSYFVVWTDDDDETWLWQNEIGCANGDIEPSGIIMGPYATAADAARAAWPNLEPLALPPSGIAEMVREMLHWPADKLFSFTDSPGAHDPCYVVMPDGAMLSVNHWADETTDIARAQWIVDVCNEKLRTIRHASDEVRMEELRKELNRSVDHTPPPSGVPARALAVGSADLSNKGVG